MDNILIGFAIVYLFGWIICSLVIALSETRHEWHHRAWTALMAIIIATFWPVALANLIRDLDAFLAEAKARRYFRTDGETKEAT